MFLLVGLLYLLPIATSALESVPAATYGYLRKEMVKVEGQDQLVPDGKPRENALEAISTSDLMLGSESVSHASGDSPLRRRCDGNANPAPMMDYLQTKVVEYNAAVEGPRGYEQNWQTQAVTMMQYRLLNLAKIKFLKGESPWDPKAKLGFGTPDIIREAQHNVKINNIAKAFDQYYQFFKSEYQLDPFSRPTDAEEVDGVLKIQSHWNKFVDDTEVAVKARTDFEQKTLVPSINRLGATMDRELGLADGTSANYLRILYRKQKLASLAKGNAYDFGGTSNIPDAQAPDTPVEFQMTGRKIAIRMTKIPYLKRKIGAVAFTFLTSGLSAWLEASQQIPVPNGTPGVDSIGQGANGTNITSSTVGAATPSASVATLQERMFHLPVAPVIESVGGEERER